MRLRNLFMNYESKDGIFIPSYYLRRNKWMQN
nr:MAG TPA: hypothetical protein [Caudoviricetes sp.]DAZ03671.1 MAG TPA: hypothetical protein [Caudoviricetes sp.]